MSTTSEKYDEMAISLVVINIVGILLGYVTTIIIARQLSSGGFELYVGAVATATLLASIGEAGFGKYAMRVIPLYAAKNRNALLLGYVRYALVGAFLTGLAISLCVGVAEVWLRSIGSEATMIWAICFVPIVAALGVAIDLLMSFRLARSAMLISKVLIPSTTLAMLGLTVYLAVFTPVVAVMCFFSGSCAAILVVAQVCRRNRRVSGATETAAFRFYDWSRRSLSFMAFYLLLSVMFRSTLAIAYHLPHDPDELAILAAAFETGSLVFLLSKSTDKYYHPEISLVLESSRWSDWTTLQRSRNGLIVIGTGAFLLVMIVFGETILAVYGSRFTAGYRSLCLIALGSSVGTAFSLSPTFLLYSGAKKQLMVLLSAHVLLLGVTTVVAFPRYGAIGAATAYAFSITSFALTSWWASNRRFRLLRQSS